MTNTSVLDDWELTEGSIGPLGATWSDDDQSYRFVLYSKNAQSVVLLLLRRVGLCGTFAQHRSRFSSKQD